MKVITKTISMILAVLLISSVFAVAPLTASAETSGDYEYEVLEDGTVEITKYNGLGTELFVPGEIDDKKVTSIGDDAFESKVTLTKVLIPDGVISIGDRAFEGCENIMNITIPNSVTDLGALYTFDGCRSLKSINIPHGVTSIGEQLFGNCESLTSVLIPDSVTSIGDWAFYNCKSLKEISIPDSVTSIGDVAFYESGYYNDDNNWQDDVLYIGHHLIKANWALSNNYTVKEGTIVIASEAFRFCEYLTDVSLPDSIKGIGQDAFLDTAFYKNENNWKNDVLYLNNYLIKAKKELSGNYIVKDNTITIADKAFYECSGLTGITIPDTVINIGEETFWECYNLLFVNLPNGLVRIGNDVFGECGRLNNISIPDTVTVIGKGAFYGCRSFTNINIPESVKEIGKFAFGYFEDGKIGIEIQGYTNTAAEKYAEENEFEFISLGDDPTAPKLDFEYKVISDGTAIIKKYNGTDINVEIPESIDGRRITGVDSCAFEDCNSVESVIIPESINTIDWHAFYGCIKLSDIVIPNDSIDIDSGAFENTAYEKDVNNWENGLLYIGNHLIKADNISGKCKVKDGTITISSGAFIYNTEITGISFPETIKLIGSQAFNGCKELKEIILPKEISEIGDLAFGFYEFYPGGDRIEYKKIEGFKIYGYSGSSAEEYAKENGFEFIDINSTSATDPTQPVTDEPTESIASSTEATESTENYSTEPATSENTPSEPSGTVADPTETTPIDNIPTEPTETQNATVNPTEPDETQPSTDKPTEPIVTEPQPTTPKPTSPVVKPTDNKKDNPVKVTVKSKTVKLKKLKKKAQKANPFTIKSAKGKVSIKITGVKKSIKKYLKFSSKGTLTIKRWKKAEKGTYKIKVKITVKGNSKYKPKTIKKTVKITIN